MKQFRVTIHLSFRAHYWDDGHGSYEANRMEKKAKKAAFDRTDKYYADHNVIEYIKTNSAMGMVECMFSNADVKSAEWDPEKFQIHMIVETEETEEDLRRDLEMNSLEDGEYEACGESGWILFTRGESGEVFYGGFDTKDVWEYGLVDYRDNIIVITPLD